MFKGVVAACIGAGVMVFGTVVGAAPLPEELKELGERMKPVALPGRDAVKPHAPTWCNIVKAEGSSSPLSIARGIDHEDKATLGAMLQAAQVTCLYPKEPAIQKAVQTIEQYWINWTGLPADKALEAFTYHLAEDRFKADQKKLCDELKVSDEIGGEEKTFMAARRRLFGCRLSPSDPQWMDNGGGGADDDLLVYLDASATPADELVRLSYLTSRTRFLHDEHNAYFETNLISYITDQFDLAAFNDATLMQQLDVAPYKGNTFARATAMESAGRLHTAMAAYKTEIAKKATDADWKELLVTAPQRGAADWNAAAGKWKDQLARSMEFEKKFWGPSKKSMQGCWPELRKDFLAVAKTLKRSSPVELQESMSAPVPSLLFTRLYACASVDADPAYAKKMYRVLMELRPSRGPRLAAQFAALDALTKIRDDRAKFPVDPQALRAPADRAIVKEAFDRSSSSKSKIDSMGFVGDGGSGMVKSVKKIADGLQITFVTSKYQTMSQSCTETNRIVTFAADGRPIYYRKCKDTGMVTVDNTPTGITVPTEWTDGIKPNAVVDFEAARGSDAARIGLPIAVYTDKSRKTLVNVMGFGL